MNKRFLSKLEQGKGNSFLARLFLTRRQRQVLLKWCLLAAGYLLLQVLQDVIFSRIRILGGCPDLVPGYLLLVVILLGPDSGGLFVLIASVFRSLAGAALGPASVLLLTVGGIALSVFRRGYLCRSFQTEILCSCTGILLHQGILFLLGIFLGLTTWERWLATLTGAFGGMLACVALYPVVKAMGKIGGEAWTE